MFCDHCERQGGFSPDGHCPQYRPAAAAFDCAPCQLQPSADWMEALGAFNFLFKAGFNGPEPNFSAAEQLGIPLRFDRLIPWVVQEIAEYQQAKRAQQREKAPHAGP